MTSYRVLNLDWSQPGDYDLLRREAEDVDVLAFVEGRRGNDAPVIVAEALPDFDVIQDISGGGDRAGSGVAVRRGSQVRVKRWSTSLVSHRGRNVQSRYRKTIVLVDRSKPRGHRLVLFGVQHNAVEHNERHDDGMRSARRWVTRADTWAALTGGRWVLAGDFNSTPEGAQNASGAFRVEGHKPMAFLLSRGWRVHFAHRPSVGTDHHVLTITEKGKA